MSAEEMNCERLLTLQDICELLNLKKSYIYSMSSQKKIPHYKIQGHLRFRLSAVENWLKSQEICNAVTEKNI